MFFQKKFEVSFISKLFLIFFLDLTVECVSPIAFNYSQFFLELSPIFRPPKIYLIEVGDL